MKKNLSISTFLFVLIAILYFTHKKYNISKINEQNHTEVNTQRKKPSKRTQIKKAWEHEFEITKDPALGYPPTKRLLEVKRVIDEKKTELASKADGAAGIHDSYYRERGPYDVGGRTRTILVDKNDPNKKTVFAAGITGGLWRTRNITLPQPYWENLGDFLENINISSVVQDPTNPNIMYFCTGEGYTIGSISGGRGLGIWKSVDSGDTWEHLPSTANAVFHYAQRMLVHPNGDVYVATRDDGVRRSQDGGETWQGVLIEPDDIADIKLASDGNMYCTTGFVSSGARIYRTLAGPNVGDNGTWERITNAAAGFPNTLNRVELAISPSNPSIIYALGSRGSNAEGIYKTTNGGASWIKNQPPTAIGMDIFTRDQGRYNLCIAVDPNDPDRVIIGGIDLLMSTNGGLNWTQISQWAGQELQYVHADQHFILYEEGNSNVIYFGNDGGVWRTTNGIASPEIIEIRHRNSGYNVTQFYACAMHPGQYSNYFLAGSQDNGTHQFDSYNIDVTREVRGGDGFFCHIDQNEPQYQIVSLYFGRYFLSNNGGQSYDAGGISIGGDFNFLNPSDYDDEANILYARAIVGERYYRWNINTQEDVEVDISNSTRFINHVAVSPNIPNRIYLGHNTHYSIIDNAHEGTSTQAQVITLPNSGSSRVSCIAIEKDNEDHVLVTKSNYGVESIFETKDGGQTWESVEGDLPDMPVRWALFNPLNSDQAFIATEAGVWVTDNLDGDNTIWMPQTNGMPSVRCDMLQTRESDNFILVGTHGRGLFTTDGLSEPLIQINIPQLAYNNVPIQFEDYSVNPSSWLWEFGDGATANMRHPEHTYTDFGTYPVTLTIEGNQTANSEIKILPNKETASVTGGTDFTGDFEDAANTDFGVYHTSGTRFERRTPVIGANSGQNAWVVGLDGEYYENNTETMLYTPRYNLTEIGIYEFSFWANYDIQQGFDGFRVEYSVNGGLDWRVLGEEGDNWYDYDNATGGTATVFPLGSHYFTGKSGGNNFKRFKTNISDLAGNQVAFRFVFRTGEAGIATGLAIDDVEINALKQEGELKTIITEFSGNFPSNTELAVNWKTQPEYRSDFFEVEYSINGRDWLKFSESERFEAAEFSIDQLAYSQKYDNQRRPLYYLRVKATGLDGDVFYSDIIVLRRNLEEVGVYSVYPNPFTDHINIAFNDFIDGDVRIEIYDALGKKVRDADITVPDIFTRIDMGDLARGTYVLRVTIGEEIFTEKILKK